MALPEGTKLMLLAPLVRGRKGQHAEVFEQIRKAGQVRVRVDGTVYDLDAVPPLDGRKAHTIEAVVDRIIIRPGSRAPPGRVAAARREAGRGRRRRMQCSSEERARSRRQRATSWTDRLFSTLYACPNCQTQPGGNRAADVQLQQPLRRLPAVRWAGLPRASSIPSWSCPIMTDRLPAARLPPGGSQSRDQWSRCERSEPTKRIRGSGFRGQREQVEAFLESQKTPLDTPLAEMRPAAARKAVSRRRQGFPGPAHAARAGVRHRDRSRAAGAARSVSRPRHLPRLRRRPPAARSPRRPHRRAEHRRNLPAEHRRGSRVLQLRCRLQAPSLPDSLDLRPSPSRSSPKSPPASASCRRSASTTSRSTGPATRSPAARLQRVRLATGIGSGLAGICYILDEPSIGLHPRDNQRLIDALRDLQRHDNTVLVVEHDEAMMRQADWLIDIGPGAGQPRRPGRRGRHAAGRDGKSAVDHRPLPGWRSGDSSSHAERRKPPKSRSIVHRRRDDQQPEKRDGDVSAGPLHRRHRRQRLGQKLADQRNARPGPRPPPGRHRAQARPAHGLARRQPDRQGDSDRPVAARPLAAQQSRRPTPAPSTKSARSSPPRRRPSSSASRPTASASTSPAAAARSARARARKRLEMNFLPDLFVPCPVCEGKRFNRQTLAVRYKGQSIADVLDLPIEEAAARSSRTSRRSTAC